MKLAKFSFKREAVWSLFPGLLTLLIAGLVYLIRWLVG
jgi:hypothetical protein